MKKIAFFFALVLGAQSAFAAGFTVQTNVINDARFDHAYALGLDWGGWELTVTNEDGSEVKIFCASDSTTSVSMSRQNFKLSIHQPPMECTQKLGKLVEQINSRKLSVLRVFSETGEVQILEP